MGYRVWVVDHVGGRPQVFWHFSEALDTFHAIKRLHFDAHMWEL